MDAVAHSRQSSYREMVLEHLFVGDLLRHLWKSNFHAEILKPQTDDSGYDLVVDCKGTLRHVQMKSSHEQAKTSRQNVNVKLAEKTGGCVIWIVFDEVTLDTRRFLWLGGPPGTKLSLLDYKVAKHTKGDSKGKKAERPNVRVVPKARFTKLDTIAAVVDKLFGVNRESKR